MIMMCSSAITRKQVLAGILWICSGAWDTTQAMHIPQKHNSFRRSTVRAINLDNHVDFEYCFDALQRHDTDRDFLLDQAEYFTFVQDFGSVTECMGYLELLPLELVTVWNQLACECRHRGGLWDCCFGSNARISISGVDQIVAGEPVTPQESINRTICRQDVANYEFLRQICLRVDQAIISFCASEDANSTAEESSRFPTNVTVGGIAQGPTSNGKTSWRVFDDHAITVVVLGLPPCLVLLLVVLASHCYSKRQVSRPASTKSDKMDDDATCDESLTHFGPDASSLDVAEHWDMAQLEVPARDCPAANKPSTRRFQTRTPNTEEVNGSTSHRRHLTLPEDDVEGTSSRHYSEQYLPSVGDSNPLILSQFSIDPSVHWEEPYDLEHYVPDGGIALFEREGHWAYLADQGWEVFESLRNEARPRSRPLYQRAEKSKPVVIDDRKHRILQRYKGDDEVFTRLQQSNESILKDPRLAESKERGLGWVIQSSLKALDETRDDLEASFSNDTDSSCCGVRCGA